MIAPLLSNQIARPAGAINDTRRRLQADGPATVLGIGTANPPNFVRQQDYADYYFRVTKSEHLTDLKAKLRRICYKSPIKKRYFHHTEELLDSHPEFANRTSLSLDARQDILATAVPELAAAKAIAEWGRPATEITDLVVSSYSGAQMPGIDFHLASLLGLRPSVRRTMMYMNGCSGGAAALRLAKDIAENNRGARVLVACAELTLIMFRAPHEAQLGSLVMQPMQALLGDGAGAVVVGADPVSGEQPGFEMVSASQTTIPESKNIAVGRLGADGFLFNPSKELPLLVRENIERCVGDALAPLGTVASWNDLFWAVHPGGPAILDGVEAGLGLDPRKLEASRRVLREYGNMSGPSVIFVLDELRRQQEEMNEMGVMVGLGPGLTVETMALRAIDSQRKV